MAEPGHSGYIIFLKINSYRSTTPPCPLMRSRKGLV